VRRLSLPQRGEQRTASTALDFTARHSLFAVRSALFHIRDLILGTSASFRRKRGGDHVRCNGATASGTNNLGTNKMKKTALLTAILVTAAGPVMARSYRVYQHTPQAYRHAHSAQPYSRHAYQGAHRSYQRSGHADEPSNSPGAHSHITCDMVRSYVAQVGLQQAKAMAVAAGMTAAEERRARQCLASKV
jgi:hypothetical protein